MLKLKTISTWQIRFLGFIKIPLIFFCRPKVVKISKSYLEIKIKLNRRTKNHLNSMYFGVLSVGADITAGFLAMKLINDSKLKISLIFKDFQAEFIKRAEGDVHFICNEGESIKNLVELTEKTDVRQNLPVNITAFVPKISTEPVAKFILTLSLKKKK